jgi:uncharacterized Zn finger protein
MRERHSSRIPAVPHEQLGVECCGCLVVHLRGLEAIIRCNECGEIIHTVPLADIEKVMAAIAATHQI